MLSRLRLPLQKRHRPSSLPSSPPLLSPFRPQGVPTLRRMTFPLLSLWSWSTRAMHLPRLHILQIHLFPAGPLSVLRGPSKVHSVVTHHNLFVFIRPAPHFHPAIPAPRQLTCIELHILSSTPPPPLSDIRCSCCFVYLPLGNSLFVTLAL